MSTDETTASTETTTNQGGERVDGGAQYDDDDVDKVPLPMPVDEEEFRNRFMEYEREKEDRKTEFLKKTIKGYETARRLYYHALRQIHFVTTGENAVKEVFPEYYNLAHKANLQKIVIAMRKIAETCYYLERFEEGMDMCEKIIDIFSKHGMNKKPLKLTYGVMGRIMIEKKELKKAKEYIEKGLELDSTSGILQKAEELLEKAMKEMKDS